MATATRATKTTRGFNVSCPLCGAGPDEAKISLALNNLKACECNSCGEEFSPALAVKKAAEQLRQWQAVAKWVALAGECLADQDDDFAFDA